MEPDGQPRHSGGDCRGRGPARWLVALGYAGWGEGQLDGEMRQHGWYAAEGRAKILFDHL
jgi:putative transcriptional regulator